MDKQNRYQNILKSNIQHRKKISEKIYDEIYEELIPESCTQLTVNEYGAL